jgi:hypothetical protein
MSIFSKGKEKIFTNFDGTNIPEDFEMPSQEIEDIDRAVFDIFDKTISFETEEKGKSRKVPVVFAAGERFALTRRKNPIRDKNNTLILPIISIVRKDIDISQNQHGFGTPIALYDQPGYYIKRRLAKQDREYQNLANKDSIKNQKNVATKGNFQDNLVHPGNEAKPGRVATRKNGKNLSYYNQNISLEKDLNNNIFEIIEIPYPQFAAIKYDVVFWAQYLKQANDMMQTLFRSFSGSAYEILTVTESGYELVLKFGSTLNTDSNFDNYSDEERMIKHSMEITVLGYIISPKNKGMPNQIRSYFSAPKIDFGYQSAPDAKVVFKNETEKMSDNLDKFVLSDLRNENDLKEIKRGETSESLQYYEKNPFTNNEKIMFSKVLSKNKRKGETVLSSLLVSELERQNE